MFENMTQIAFVFILLLTYIFSASDIQFLDGKNYISNRYNKETKQYIPVYVI